MLGNFAAKEGIMFRVATALIVTGAAFEPGLALAADAQGAPAPQPTIYAEPSLNDIVGNRLASIRTPTQKDVLAA